MTEEAKRIAIAEFCGWKRTHRPDGDLWDWYRPDGSYCLTCECSTTIPLLLPDYLHDLNAIREAVSNVKDNAYVYCETLAEILGMDLHLATFEDIFEIANAGPDKCSEALLRTIGKWVES